MEYVVLVDEQDREIGVEEKLKAHREGKLHRAFSVFLFNPKGELLMQQRAAEKYHSGGLWANTCCGHPRPEEDLAEAAARRLKEEMGISCAVEKAFHFIYRATVKSGLVEYEIDHVFVGRYDGLVQSDPNEVMAYRWNPFTELQEEIKSNPHYFVAWLPPAVEQMRRRQIPQNLR